MFIFLLLPLSANKCFYVCFICCIVCCFYLKNGPKCVRRPGPKRGGSKFDSRCKILWPPLPGKTQTWSEIVRRSKTQRRRANRQTDRQMDGDREANLLSRLLSPWLCSRNYRRIIRRSVIVNVMHAECMATSNWAAEFFCHKINCIKYKPIFLSLTSTFDNKCAINWTLKTGP